MALAIPTMGTSYSPFWNANPQTPAVYVPKYARSSQEYRAAQALNDGGYRKYRARLRALNGVVPGSSAVDTKPRVQQTVGGYAMGGSGLGGVRTIETVTNTSTTLAADVTFANTFIYDRVFTRHPTSYPTDASGNGGGAKLGR